MARQRTNARRTMPEDGCEQRPIHPHEEGCPGWLWFTRRGKVIVERCSKCRTFDDDQEASDHVNHCRACKDLIETDAEDEGIELGGERMPSLAKRRRWADWANDMARASRYGNSAPVLDAASDFLEVAGWLKWNDPNGDYFSKEPDRLARAWNILGDHAEDEMEGDG